MLLNMFRFPLCLLLIYELCVPIVGLAMLGPVDLIFKRIEHCVPELHVIDFWITQRKYNRSVSIFDITVSNPYQIDDTLTLELKGSMKKEGGYKPGAMYFKDTVCEGLEKMIGDIFLDVLQRMGTEKCPLPPGDHEVLNFYFDNNKFNVPQLYGDYKLDIFIFKGDDLQSCYIAYFDFVPKS